MNILSTGMSGMVGMRLRERWQDTIVPDDASAAAVDITNPEAVEQWVANSEASVILHMAAKTDVDGCEDDKLFGEEGEAWQINVTGTEHIIESAKKHKKRVIYLSTDFVFDGTKESYNEDDEANAVNWYGRTKEEGERVVRESQVPWTIVRIAYPYGARSQKKQDFVARMSARIKEKLPLTAVSDHRFTPTYIDDIGDALALLLQKPYDGVYHVVGSQAVSTLDAADMIAKSLGMPATITPITREAYFKGRAFRPRNLVLNNARITELGIHMRGFEEGLRAVNQER